MSVGSKSLPAHRRADDEGGPNGGGGAVVREEEEDLPIRGGGGGGGSRGRKQKAARYDRCFSGLELSIGPGPLKDVDAGSLKDQIRRWAKAVVAFARQISFGSPRSSVPTSGGSGGAAAVGLGIPGGGVQVHQPPRWRQGRERAPDVRSLIDVQNFLGERPV